MRRPLMVVLIAAGAMLTILALTVPVVAGQLTVRGMKARIRWRRTAGLSIAQRFLVERWFAYLTQKRIRRGSFHSVPSLIEAIFDHIDNNNQNPHIFVWTASVERIMSKIAKCKEASDSAKSINLEYSRYFTNINQTDTSVS